MNAVVIVPTYNERENLPSLVDALLRHDGVRVLVVDDRSPDGTGDVADGLAQRIRARVEVMHRTTNGAGSAARTSTGSGSPCAIGRVEVVCQMDADLSHDPQHLRDLIAASEHADVVIGSRYVPGGAIVNWPPGAVCCSAASRTPTFAAITRLRPRDCTSGYRCWRRDALATLPLDRFISDGYSFLVEMLFVASRRGLRIAEVPITFVERRLGESKLSQAVLVESAITPWRLVASRKAVRPTVR